MEERVAEKEVQEWMSTVLDKLRETLNDKEKAILADRLLSDEPLTLQDIADKFDISRERVRQIEANLLKKMREYFEKEVPDIKDFLAEFLNPWRS